MGVWIETSRARRLDKLLRSHPSWVCGLKQQTKSLLVSLLGSHPSWVCGLKPLGDGVDGEDSRVTPFVGVWIETSLCAPCSVIPNVTPFVGVWIETSLCLLCFSLYMSHPSWVCGLKLSRCLYQEPREVTPFVGVWIETPHYSRHPLPLRVTPFVGVWIETYICLALLLERSVTPFVGVWIETSTR